jgi:hypothetical protein
MEQDIGATNTTQGKPWAGKPGQFRNSWQPLNAIDAITKAGANPLGLAQANPNDIKLVSNYYSANPQVANQYDLRTNLFLRYIAGTGTKDLEISPETGREIYQITSKSHDPIRGMADKAIQKGYTKRYLPESAWASLSKEERAETDQKKRTGSRQGKQFIPNTDKAKKAGRAARRYRDSK